MSFIYVFLLILFAHESFSASFDRLPCAFQVCGFSPEKAQVIYRSVGDIHQRLTDEQYDLYLGITEELDKESPNSSAPGAAGGGVRKLAKLNASSGKSESGRSSKKENDSI